MGFSFWSCSQKPESEQIADDSLQFESISLMKISSGCSEQKQECARVSVDFPLATNGESLIKEKINNVTKQKVLESLAVFSEHDSKLIVDLDAAMAEFIKLYESYVTDSDFFTIPWELKINGEVLFQSQNTVSLRLDNSSYTGGAHPNQYTTLLNFNTETGNLIQLKDVVRDINEFKIIAEELLLGKNKKKEDEVSDHPVIELTSDSYFMLPENFSIQEDGILLFYNPYEASDYANGSLTFLISYDELKPILSENFKEVD